MLVVSLPTIVMTHQMVGLQLQIIVAHQPLLITVAHHQLVVELQLLITVALQLLLITVVHHQLVVELLLLLLLLIITPPYLLHLQAITIPKIPRIWPTLSWQCITASVLQLEFLRLYEASILPPAPRLGPTI